jgi:hypothetical protein
MLQHRQKVLAKAPSTHDPKRTWAFALHMSAFGVTANDAKGQTRRDHKADGH